MPNDRIKGPGFHHVAIRAFDFDATLKFYQEGFGFKRAYGWGSGDGSAAMLDLGDGNYLEVFAGRKPGDTPPEGGLLHFALRVPDTDAAYARAMAAGAISQTEPKEITIDGDRPVKVRLAFVKGPNGEVIEFFQNDEL